MRKASQYGLFFLIILIAFAAGMFFGAYHKAKTTASSILNVSQNASSPTPAVLGTSLSMPTGAVKGSDIAGISLMPGSVRSNYLESGNGNFTSVEYFIKSNFYEISEYYSKNLNGWGLDSSDITTLTFVKDKASLTVKLLKTDNLNKIAQYSLSLTKTNL